MNFSEKVRQARTQKGLTQGQLAKEIGVVQRTVASYETDNRYPRTKAQYAKLAEALNVDINYLLTENEEFTLEARKKYGPNGAKQAKMLVSQIAGLFAGGNLSDEDKDAVMKAMQQVYWDAKKENKKYTPKKYRKGD